ncbi:MAG TPA: SDR family NAD(P)-dependent oxidoreductase [Anaerolineae bacterium]|nr:SDR family NAD(P)-dependent oxidoreductase [Anaerolineae bacterium]
MEINKNAFLVTGGSSGLGAATAKMLIEAGAKVVIADIDSEAGQKMATALGEQVYFVRTDVTDEVAVQAAVQAVVEKFGELRGVINCAGLVLARRVLSKSGTHDLASFSRLIQVNLIGTFNVARLAAAAMVENEPVAEGERGVIINTASIAAFEGQIGQVAYASSKGGVVAMTLPLARDLARNGIRVVAIAPGIFDTPMMASLPEPARLSLGQQVPFPPRLGKPEEYAFLARHIIENVMLNGEVIRLDGATRFAAK